MTGQADPKARRGRCKQCGKGIWWHKVVYSDGRRGRNFRPPSDQQEHYVIHSCTNTQKTPHVTVYKNHPPEEKPPEWMQPHSPSPTRKYLTEAEWTAFKRNRNTQTSTWHEYKQEITRCMNDIHLVTKLLEAIYGRRSV